MQSSEHNRQCIPLMIITLLYTANQLLAVSAANVHNRSTERQLAQHLVWDQGAEHICPLVSHGLHSEANYGLPKGSVWLGDIWLSLVLCNPQPSPSAWRPRCAEPASLQLHPTPLELCHSWLFNLAIIPSLVPITRHARGQISCINNCGSPSQFGSTEAGSTGEASAVDVGGKV